MGQGILSDIILSDLINRECLVMVVAKMPNIYCRFFRQPYRVFMRAYQEVGFRNALTPILGDHGFFS